MLALRGAINSGLVKALATSNSNVPLLSNASSSLVLLTRNQSAVTQTGTQQSGNGNYHHVLREL